MPGYFLSNGQDIFLGKRTKGAFLQSQAMNKPRAQFQISLSRSGIHSRTLAEKEKKWTFCSFVRYFSFHLERCSPIP